MRITPRPWWFALLPLCFIAHRVAGAPPGLPSRIVSNGSVRRPVQLTDPVPIPVAFETRSGALPPSVAGVSLASGDLDDDGVPDLVAGYADGSSGLLVILRGGSEAIGQAVPSLFRPGASILEVPAKPDFLLTGDFDADGDTDVVVATRGGDELWCLRGEGRGSLSAPDRLGVPGRISTLSSGDLDRADGLPDIAVGIVGSSGPRLLLFESAKGAFNALPETLDLPDEAVELAVDQFDSEFPIDLVVAAGRSLFLLHGEDRRLALVEEGQAGPRSAGFERIDLGYRAVGLAAGQFSRRRDGLTDLAVLSDTGSVHFLAASAPLPGPGWEMTEESYSAAVSGSSAGGRLARARVSDSASDSVLVSDTSASKIHVLAPDETGAAGSGPAATIEMAAPSSAVQSMKLNADGLEDVVILPKGASPPMVSMGITLSTFTVNSLGDTPDAVLDGVCADGGGFCTLRAAIQEANAVAGADTISFALGAGTPTISPASALPDLTGPVSILGDTGGATRIELNGAGAGAGTNGLRLGSAASASLLRSLVINRFNGVGIRIDSDANQVGHSFIGTDNAGGSSVAGNTGGGILMTGSAARGNVLGGTYGTPDNVISHNIGAGVRIESGASFNKVIGSYIGTTASGSSSNFNNTNGVLVTTGASNNQIGGTTSVSPGNVISGNNGFGIEISSGTTSGNLVRGNLIGTTASGLSPLGNTQEGVLIRTGAASNTVGGSTVSARNVISAAPGTADGIEINGANSNIIQGNYIGTDVTGTVDLGNGGAGVNCGSSSGTIVGGLTATPGTPPGNVISGNTGAGMSDCSGTILGNLVGTNASGTAALGNSGNGLGGFSGTVGGSTVNARNVISANGLVGITNAVSVQGNYIGLDITGTVDLGNGSFGASSSTVGGPTAVPGTPPGNVISGNGSVGVLNSISVKGNLIGLNASGTAAIGNNGGVSISSGSSTIGGTLPTERNIISGNFTVGVDVIQGGATIIGNFIGTDITGTIAIGNVGDGVLVEGPSGAGTIGGITTSPGSPPGNVISGNDQVAGSAGVRIITPSQGIVIIGNIIGADVSGTLPLPNRDNGVLITNPAGQVTIGGSATGSRNLISGNSLSAAGDGIEINNSSLNKVLGNWIGLSSSGTSALPNGGSGVLLTNGAKDNQIGGTTPGEANVISGNGTNGVTLTGAATKFNTVSGNSIGPNATGGAGAGNAASGILVTSGSALNLLGGTSGVVAGSCAGACNLVANNIGAGIRIDDASSYHNAIRANSIRSNAALGIDLGPAGVTPNDSGDGDSGANGLQNFPVISSASFNGSNTTITGTLNSLAFEAFTIDIYGNSALDPTGFGEGETYLGSAGCSTDGTGNCSFSLVYPGNATLITATAAHPVGATSEFSAGFMNPGEASSAGDMQFSKGAGTSVDVTYTPACGANDHAIYWGTSPIVSAVNWTACTCWLGMGGTANFDPGNPPAGKVFYAVIVGKGASREGSYGRNSGGSERVEAVGVGPCDVAQELTVTCP